MDNIVGSVVAYGNKAWFAKFPTLLDDNVDPTVKSFLASKILKGLDEYNVLFGL